MSGGGGDPLETSLLFDVFACNQAVRRLLEEAMVGGPLTPSEYAVYSAVFELESATPTALSARLGMRLTTFIDQLRSMEGRGHARRLPNPRDRRSHLITLTAAGLAAHRAANRLFESAYAAFVAELRQDLPVRQSLSAIRAAAERASTLQAATVSPRRSADPGG